MKEWIIEVKAIEGSHAHKVISDSQYLGLLTKYLEWCQLMPTDIPKLHYPQDLETVLTYFNERYHPDYHYRIRNIETDEIIPMDIFR